MLATSKRYPQSGSGSPTRPPRFGEGRAERVFHLALSGEVRRLALAVLAVALTGITAACGGSGGDNAASERPAAVPPAAGAPAPGGGLSVEEALESTLDSVLLVRGALVVVGDMRPRLCSALAESFPPQCGAPSLVVEGLDLATIESLQAEGDVRWAEDVELLGTVQSGLLTVSATSI